jgi:hypothetical protein
MIKFIDYAGLDEYGSHIELLHPNVLIKTAGYSSELDSYVKNLKPEDGKTYVLINAMGDMEHYGSNRNGDAFPEEALKKYHKTFEKLGHAYKHHKNKDSTRSYGKVKFSHYNPDMHRVELVVELDKSKPEVEEIINQIEKGNYPPTSMGVKLPHDECSVCHNKSKTTNDYCNHLKYEMNKVYSDGRKVAALNRDDLKFFDISFVRIPADKTSGVMAKLASINTTVSSVDIAQEILKDAGVKEADLIKEIEGNIKGVNDDPRRLISTSQMEMPVKELHEILQHYSLAELLSTLIGLRIMPTKKDFQRMVIISINHPDMAKLCSLDNELFVVDDTVEPIIPEDVSLDNFSDGIAQKIASWIPEMSLTKPLVIKRALIKMAALDTLEGVAGSVSSGQKTPFMAMTGLGALYAGYHRLMDVVRTEAFEKFMLARPWTIPLLVTGVTAAAVAGQYGIRQHMLHKTAAAAGWPYAPNYLKRMLIGVPATYLYAGYQENKLRQGQQISDFGNLVRKHPFLASMVATYGLHKGPKVIKAIKTAELAFNYDSFISKLTPEKLDELYQDVIGTPRS